MHEAAVATALLEQVRTFAPAGASVRSVRIDVGELEHVDSLVLATAWEALTAGDSLEGSELEVRRVPVRVRCRGCGSESRPVDLAILTCRACGAVRPEVLEGSGILLRALDVEEAP